MRLAIWSRLILGRSWTGIVGLDRDHKLVVSGPYRYLKHLIYIGMMLAFTGTALVLGYLPAYVAVFIIGAAIARKILLEEHMMRRVFPTYGRGGPGAELWP